MALKVAITGGIGEGKSTLLGWLAEEGYSVWSSDQLARELFADPEINARIAAIVGTSPPIAPADVRSAILRSHPVRRQVNRLMHPRILDALSGPAARGPRSAAVLFHEVPLLIETCLQSRYDEVWVATCGEEEQRKRLIERWGDARLADALLATQLPSRAKEIFADRVFRTNQPPENVRASLRKAARELIE